MLTSLLLAGATNAAKSLDDTDMLPSAMRRHARRPRADGESKGISGTIVTDAGREKLYFSPL